MNEYPNSLQRNLNDKNRYFNNQHEDNRGIKDHGVPGTA